MKIIDIGCWGGENVMRLLMKGHDAYGIDITDEHFPEEMKDHLDKVDICQDEVKFVGDFDQAIMSDVLEHVEDDHMALRILEIY